MKTGDLIHMNTCFMENYFGIILSAKNQIYLMEYTVLTTDGRIITLGREALLDEIDMETTLNGTHVNKPEAGYEHRVKRLLRTRKIDPQVQHKKQAQ